MSVNECREERQVSDLPRGLVVKSRKFNFPNYVVRNVWRTVKMEGNFHKEFKTGMTQSGKEHMSY